MAFSGSTTSGGRFFPNIPPALYSSASHRRGAAVSAAAPILPPPSSPPLLRRGRRAPLVGALWVLGLGGTLAALSAACRTGCVYSHRSLPFLRSSAKDIHFTTMESVAGTVPSIVVYVTVPNKEAGKKLSESIIKERLAACVNRVPGIESVYWWEGQVQSDSEELLIIKTRESLLDALTEHVKSNHEYEVPEVISLPITGGNLKYLEWIKNNTRDN